MEYTNRPGINEVMDAGFRNKYHFWLESGELDKNSRWSARNKIWEQGTILQFEPEKVLEYSYWSSLSQHADVPENYSVITFKLTPVDGKTILTFTQSNFETEVSYKHFNYYWNVALGLLKRLNDVSHP